MFRCVGRAITILALCCAIGLHWAALQSTAWSMMLVENAKHSSLTEAIAKTFDGAHPCSLCHVVQKGKGTEKKSDLQANGPKIDLLCITRVISLSPPFTLLVYTAGGTFVPFRSHVPPVPPPRAVRA